ncbi:MAG: GNAT family N-acetyltransferase [Lachnospiraceae bacterium]|nr:GNAT family N-acetyltransferase [Ruminococcus sp.]MCM1275091.1 GNAT family N-acetyltransferase [Lachnospiraceae bacterium]
MIRFAENKDIGALSKLDSHISAEELLNSVRLLRVIVRVENGRLLGWLRYGLFWDNIPFMNMLYVIDGERGKGIGTALADFWENEMRKNGHALALASTLSNERGQFFFRGRGYGDCGSLILPNEVTEIIMYKELEDGNGRNMDKNVQRG